MNLTQYQQNKLDSYQTSIRSDEKKFRLLSTQLKQTTKRLASYNRVVKYLLCLRDGDLQGQIEAKLNWNMLEPIEFTYNGVKVKGLYKGAYGAYGKSIKLDGVHYQLKQIIKENIENHVTNTDTPT